MNASASMLDINNRQQVDKLNTKTPVHTTNKKAGTSLDMTDFLNLMVAMFQNQDMENTASTTDMMNQMVQMSVVQAITNISTLIDDSTVMTYAASLVGKEVTIGQYTGKELKEITGVVTGTGTLNGQQVVFIGNDSYYLTDIMAVGRLPDKEDLKVPGKDDEDKDDSTDGVGDVGGSDGDDSTGGTDGTDNVGGSEGTEGSGDAGDTGNTGGTDGTDEVNPGETPPGVTDPEKPGDTEAGGEDSGDEIGGSEEAGQA